MSTCDHLVQSTKGNIEYLLTIIYLLLRREFFIWDLNSAVPGEPLEAAAVVNAHTDGILALDTSHFGILCRVLCGSRDETVSLYSVEPVVRLATFNGCVLFSVMIYDDFRTCFSNTVILHIVFYSVCSFKSKQTFTHQLFRRLHMRVRSHQAEVSAVCWLRNGDGRQASIPEEDGNENNSPITPDVEMQLFASGSYDGQIKVWDARQDNSKTLAGNYCLYNY